MYQRWSAVLIAFFISSVSFAQGCNSGLTSGSWQGATKKGVGNIYSTKVVQVTYDSSALTIADFTAGFMEQLGHEEDYNVTFSIDCNGDFTAKTIQSKFGAIVLSGSYSAAQTEIIINWEIPGSGIIEQTSLTL